MNYSTKGLKLTNEEYDSRLIHYNLKRLDNYIDSKTSIRHGCVYCDKIFKVKPKELSRISCDCILKGSKYKQSLKSKSIELLENYKNVKSKLLHKCLKCKNEFLTMPKTILHSKVGCPSCSGKKFTEEKYKSLLPSTIKLKGEYIDSSKRTLHECSVCGNLWTTKPNYILHMGCGCPECASSKGERIITNYLQYLKINFKKEKLIEFNGIKYRFDFFLDEIEVVIEFDGIQHFVPREFFGGVKYLEKIQESDKNKSVWCKKNGYRLIRITYKQLDYLTIEHFFNLIYN